MRGHLVIAMMFGAAFSAQAAHMPDLPILRGSLPAGLSTSDGELAGILHRRSRRLWIVRPEF